MSHEKNFGEGEDGVESILDQHELQIILITLGNPHLLKRLLINALQEPILTEQIVRASSWNQLFTSHEEEQQDFLEHIVGTQLREYEGNNTLSGYIIKKNHQGDIHFFKRTTKGDNTVVQKRVSDGNVVMMFNSLSHDPHISVITPTVGNIDHPYTFANLVMPSYERLNELSDKKIEKVTGTNKIALRTYISGKPATDGWEKTMVSNGHFPQRIGHRIFPDFILQAQKKLLEAYPRLFVEEH